MWFGKPVAPGWRRYAQYAELANRARSDFEAAARPGA